MRQLIQALGFATNGHLNGHLAQAAVKSVSVAAAKNTLTELLREVESGRPVGISRRGQGVAVLLSAAEYERLKVAGASADFSAWLQTWRDRLGADFEGISADELARWAAD